MSKHRKNTVKTPEKKKYISPIEEESINILKSADSLKKEMDGYYNKMLDSDMSEDAEMKAESLKRTSFNLKKASKKAFDIQDELYGRLGDIKRQHKKSKIMSAPANAAIDLKEKQMNHFAKGINAYKLMLICFIGSFAGVIIEMLWCVLTRGYIESRAGLVYGPFNLLYGFGAMFLSICLYKFRNRGIWVSFIGGFVVGSVLEYVCSWGQEFVFGSRSWDYSKMPFNINGRICLLYSAFWGILGVLWIKYIYPKMAKLILKIPNKSGKIATWILLAFFVVNAAVSFTALGRWSQRKEGIPASNSFWEFVDDRFDDERMERIYANMEFGDKN